MPLDDFLADESIPQVEVLVESPPVSPPPRAKKTVTKTIPKPVLVAWNAVYENFTTRHKNLKQTPLKTLYAIVNAYFEGE